MSQRLASRRRGERHRQRAEALDPLVRATMEEAMGALRTRLGITGIGWRDLQDTQDPLHRSIYEVFPAPSALDASVLKAANLEAAVREALRRHGYPDELLAHVSVHATSAEIMPQ